MLKLITKSGNFGSLNEQTFTDISVRNWEIVVPRSWKIGRHGEGVKKKKGEREKERTKKEEGKTFFALEDTQTLVWKMGS